MVAILDSGIEDHPYFENVNISDFIKCKIPSIISENPTIGLEVYLIIQEYYLPDIIKLIEGTPTQ